VASGGEHETRTRVMCNLPLNNAPQEKAFKEIIKYIQSQQTLKIGVTGYTYSAPGTFYGFWWNIDLDAAGDWEQDKIVLLMVDYEIPMTHPTHSISEKIAELKATIEKAYSDYGMRQMEVWVIASTVNRYL
jgi:hypothetical protein